MQLETSDYLIQSDPAKLEIYRRHPGIWFSDEIKRWIVVRPDIVREAMTNSSFSVPLYKTGNLGSRIGRNFNVIEKITSRLPLAHEGEQHKMLRAKFARIIAAQTPKALLRYQQTLDARLLNCLDGGEFCLVQDLIGPAVRSAISELSGIELPNNMPIEDIPQIFDDAISGRRRLAIQGILEQLIANSQFETQEETEIAVALVAVSVNTLLGSLVRSTEAQIAKSEQTSLCNIDWPEDFTHTSLALVEKFAIRDSVLADIPIKSGDRIRLFLDSAGYESGIEMPVYSDLYFAVGMHRCVGMSFSRQAWNILVNSMKSHPHILNVVDVEYRSGDYVFLFPKKCRVKVVSA